MAYTTSMPGEFKRLKRLQMRENSSSVNDTLGWKNAHTSAAPRRASSGCAGPRKNFPRLTCAFHFFSAWLIAISHSFPPSSSRRLSFPGALFDAFLWNLSLPELISQPLSVFQVSVSHLHHARLDLSPQPLEAPVYLLRGISLCCFLHVSDISQLRMVSFLAIPLLFYFTPQFSHLAFDKSFLLRLLDPE